LRIAGRSEQCDTQPPVKVQETLTMIVDDFERQI